MQISKEHLGQVSQEKDRPSQQVFRQDKMSFFLL